MEHDEVMRWLQDIENALPSIEMRLKGAVARFKAGPFGHEWAAIEDLARDAHAQAAAGHAPDHPELAWVLSFLDKADRHLKHEIADDTIVEPDGTLVGVRKYEQLDPHWTLALIEYLEHRHHRASLGDRPSRLKMADQARIAIAGDWGTGYWRGAKTPAAKVARAIETMKPAVDYTIHLGDVYYAGTQSEEISQLSDVWPRGSKGQYLLNSNHEMYSGGGPLFQQAIPSLAPQQEQTSYWSLENDHAFLLGLDTAYFATELYLDGNLGVDNAQTRWLASLRNVIGNRSLIVLSHHQPVNFAGDTTTLVYKQLTDTLGKTPDFWYWGHLHNVIVYKNLPQGMSGRCVGHGAIPYGDAKALKDAPNVDWYEEQTANDKEYPERVLNGFLLLELSGASIREQLIGEDGSVRWTHTAALSS